MYLFYIYDRVFHFSYSNNQLYYPLGAINFIYGDIFMKWKVV